MFTRIFLDHPKQVDETYSQHAFFALNFASKLFIAGIAATIHALVPAMFEKTASSIVAELYRKTHNRSQTQSLWSIDAGNFVVSMPIDGDGVRDRLCLTLNAKNQAMLILQNWKGTRWLSRLNQKQLDPSSFNGPGAQFFIPLITRTAWDRCRQPIILHIR